MVVWVASGFRAAFCLFWLPDCMPIVVAEPVVDAELAAASTRLVGFTILQGAVSLQDLKEARRAVQGWRQDRAHTVMREAEQDDGEVTPQTIPDVLGYAELRPYFDAISGAPVLHSVLRSYFGAVKYRILRHSDIGINRVVGWHRDLLAGDYKRFQVTDVWQPLADGTEYSILKVSVYLEDHRADDMALRVLPGSHRRQHMHPTHDEAVLGHVTLNPAPGDIIVFDQRLWHRGAKTLASETDRLLFSVAMGPDDVFSREHEAGSIARQERLKAVAEKAFRVAGGEAFASGAETLLTSKQHRRLVLDAVGCDGAFCCLTRGLGQLSPRRLPKGAHKLSHIAHRYRALTDKVPTTSLPVRHSHTEFYGPMLEPRRHDVRYVLEVGVRGGGSLLMWRDFFPNAQVWGIDRTLDELKISGENLQRVHVLKGNGVDAQFISDQLPNVSFDLVVNDALKSLAGQRRFLQSYYRRIRPGGWLVLEDVPSPNDAAKIVEGFDGDRNRLSVIDRTGLLPSFCDERLVIYSP